MKVLGVSGSPRKDKSTERLVQAVLEAVGVDTEFVSLAGKRIGPCIADLSKQPGKLEEARAIGRNLGKRLKGFAAAT